MSFGHPPLGFGDTPQSAASRLSRRYQVVFWPPLTNVDQTWVCPRTGEYTIYAWGPGGSGHLTSGAGAGGSGALSIWQRARFSAGDIVTIAIPSYIATSGDTVCSTPRKATPITAGRGGTGLEATPGAAGVATGGDINLNGSAGKMGGTTGNPGGGTDGGAGGEDGAPGAPGYDGFRGGAGREVSTSFIGPGGGGRGAATVVRGAPGQVIICRDK